MSMKAAPLIQSKYASDTISTEYASPSGVRTIIDKFTATNTDGSSQTITVHIVPAGGTAGNSNKVASAKSISAGTSLSVDEVKSHTLAPGDYIAVIASVASKIVIRASGRRG